MPIERHQVGTRMSQAVVHGATVYLAGQVGDTPEADVGRQTTEILRKIEALLAAAGSDKSKLLSATVWISDMRHFAEMNAVWDAWVAPGNTPGRACVEARLAAPHWKVEIAVVAARD
jgi:enamine deaminase RidA (YjgF/YER057c/UK114 family)